jgi:hypothetical protein
LPTTASAAVSASMPRGASGWSRRGRGRPSRDLLPIAPTAARPESAARGSACIRTTVDRMSAPDPCTTSASGPAPTAAASGSGPSTATRSTSRCSPTATSTGRSSARRSSADAHGVWEGSSAALVPGARYGLRVDGPTGFDHAFNPVHTLLDPYARGLAPVGRRIMARRRARTLATADGGFDWAASPSPASRSTTRSSTRRTCAASRS